MSDIVNKLWGFCHTLRHDGVDSGDYIEQLTYLLFLKMAEEKGVSVPNSCRWVTLKDLSGEVLMDHYVSMLKELKEQDGILGDIFSQPIPRINNSKNLKKLIQLIDEENWTDLDIDVQGAAFEGLLEKAASEGKKGAGQYFTPREVIKSIVNVMKPNPIGIDDFKISDPACGTGGFLIVAYEWLLENFAIDKLSSKEKIKLRTQTYTGQELVNRPQRLALMNLFLHGVEPLITLGDTIYGTDNIIRDQLSCVLTNPPFGTKGSSEVPQRTDFVVKTSNKQLNFIQYVQHSLKNGGRASMVLPDNCLFDDKAAEVLKDLMGSCNLHTILKLPDGTFSPYAQGVKANVIFFQKGVPTDEVWIYDARTNIPSVTKRGRPLSKEQFVEFEKCYGQDENGKSKREENARFKRFPIEAIIRTNYKLNFSWDVDVKSTVGKPKNSEKIISEAISELESIVEEFKELFQFVK